MDETADLELTLQPMVHVQNLPEALRSYESSRRRCCSAAATAIGP